MSTRSPKIVSHGLCRSITCWSVSTPRGRGDQREAAKDRQSGSSCHGHCKCPFTVHLAPGLQSTGGRVDSAPGPLSALVFCHPSILLSVCLSAPRSDIRLERSHFLSIPLYLTAPGKRPTWVRAGWGEGLRSDPQLTWADLTPIWKGINSSSGNLNGQTCQQLTCLIISFSDLIEILIKMGTKVQIEQRNFLSRTIFHCRFCSCYMGL